MAIPVSDWGNWNEAQGLLPQTFHREGKLKREGKNPGKQFMFVTWFSLAGAAFSYQPLAGLPQFFPLFFTSALKPATAALSPFS